MDIKNTLLRLTSLLAQLDQSAMPENIGLLSDEISKKLYGGIKYANDTCNNGACDNTNKSCTNDGCTGSTVRNSGCTNYGCAS